MELAAKMCEIVQAEKRGRILSEADIMRAITNTGDGGSGYVNEYSALTNPAVFQTVLNFMIAAMLPKHLFQRMEDGTKKRIYRHPLNRILSLAWNPKLNHYDAWCMFIANYVLRGKAFAQIIRNNRGQIIELWPINPNFVTVEDSGLELKFHVNAPNAPMMTVPQSDMLFMFGFRLEGWQPFSMVQLGSDTISTGLAMDQYMSKFFTAGGSLRGALRYPTGMKPDQITLAEESWKRANGGVGNLQKVAILPGGAEFQTIGVDPEKAQMTSARISNVQDVSRFSNTPPSRLNEHSNSTLKNVEQQGIEFVQYVLSPLITNIESTMNMQCLTREEQDNGYYIEFNVDGLLRGDFKSRYEAYAIAIQNTIMTPNEVRAKENLNPRPGGDEVIMGSGMQTKSMQEANDNEEIYNL